jgi:DNA-binding transcriptional LysR family regulator
MITMKEIERVLALAGHRHFGRAAEAVDITQPALTRCIAGLEERLGVKVVDRGRWGVELTEFGRLIVDRGHEILQQSAGLEHEIEQLRGLETGELTISFAPYAGEIAGHPAVVRLVASNTGIRCRVRVSDWHRVAEDVLAGHNELGLADIAGAELSPALQTMSISRHPLHLFCRANHDLLRRRTLTLADLLAYPWATTRAPTRMGKHFPQDLGKAGTWSASSGEFLPSIELDVVHDIAKIAVDSDVVIVAAPSMVEAELATGALAPIPFSAPWLHLRYGLIFRKHRTLSAVARAFAEHLSRIETELDEREAILRGRYWSGPASSSDERLLEQYS